MRTCLMLLALAGALCAASQSDSKPPEDPVGQLRSTYVLGPDDQFSIWALEAEEFAGKTFRVGTSGYISLPMAGRIRAAGLTIEQFEAELISRLRKYVQEPQVSVTLTEFRSQPVSVIGAVMKPGVHQLQGRKTLVEILSLVEGLKPDAGHSVKITRRLEWGRIPLPTAADDPTAQFSVATVNLRAVMEAKNPQENILIRPYDVISVPRADMVYVIGEVKKAGGFVMHEQETMSALQALSLAEGMTRTAAPKSAKILRPAPGSSQRAEIPLDLNKILAGKGADVPLRPEDILFVPNNAAKSAGMRAAEAAIQIGTGVIIWRR